jgi:hypothetical protein
MTSVLAVAAVATPVPVDAPFITGVVRVLFVSVSVVAFPIRVSVPVGRVSVPEPATAGAAIVMLPEVSPATTIELMMPPLEIEF